MGEYGTLARCIGVVRIPQPPSGLCHLLAERDIML
jgi:hypothetical protein